MKTIKLLIPMFFFAICGFAQEKNNQVKGYWVVEGNIKTPKENMIRFYNHENKLIYSEKVSGRRINIDRPRVQKMLNASLQAVIAENFDKGSLVFASRNKR